MEQGENGVVQSINALVHYSPTWQAAPINPSFWRFGDELSEVRHRSLVEKFQFAVEFGIKGIYRHLIHTQTDSNCRREFEGNLMSYVIHKVGWSPIWDDPIIVQYGRRASCAYYASGLARASLV